MRSETDTEIIITRHDVVQKYIPLVTKSFQKDIRVSSFHDSHQNKTGHFSAGHQSRKINDAIYSPRTSNFIITLLRDMGQAR